MNIKTLYLCIASFFVSILSVANSSNFLAPGKHSVFVEDSHFDSQTGTGTLVVSKWLKKGHEFEKLKVEIDLNGKWGNQDYDLNNGEHVSNTNLNSTNNASFCNSGVEFIDKQKNKITIKVNVYKKYLDPDKAHGRTTYIYIAHTSTGKKIWDFTETKDGQFPETYTCIRYDKNNHIIMFSSRTSLIALNADTGKVAWVIKKPGNIRPVDFESVFMEEPFYLKDGRMAIALIGWKPRLLIINAKKGTALSFNDNFKSTYDVNAPKFIEIDNYLLMVSNSISSGMSYQIDIHGYDINKNLKKLWSITPQTESFENYIHWYNSCYISSLNYGSILPGSYSVSQSNEKTVILHGTCIKTTRLNLETGSQFFIGNFLFNSLIIPPVECKTGSLNMCFLTKDGLHRMSKKKYFDEILSKYK